MSRAERSEQGRTYDFASQCLCGRSATKRRAEPKRRPQAESAAIAIFSASTHHVSRAQGSSAVAAAAYRAGVSLVDQRLVQVFDYTRKSGVLESRLVLPAGVELDAAWGEGAREKLWNAAEAAERYKTARVAREWRLALPAELSAEARAACAYRFAQAWADQHGVAVDVALHAPSKEGDDRNWHAHLLCTTRCLTQDGRLGAKSEVEWSDTARKKSGLARSAAEIADARQLWADIVNTELEAAGLPDRIDPRSNEARGVELEPTRHVGAKATARRRKGWQADRVDADEATRLKNAEAIRRKPEEVLSAIISREAVFTRHDMARELNHHIDDPEEFQVLLARLEQSAELVQLAPEVRDAAGHVVEPARYSTCAMIRTERAMADAATRMHSHRTHAVDGRVVAEAVQRAGTLTAEQQAAVEHILDGPQISAIIGDAGTGKSFSMRVAREAWEAAGYRVIGAALAGKAADGLQEGSGIESRTLHSLEIAWKKAADPNDPNRLTTRTVVVIDEAGMVGSQQLARIIALAEKAGAKVVLVGDDKQLQAVEGGAPFRAIVERIGASEITDIRRQNEAWAKAASMALARGAVKDGLDAYQARGHVRMEATCDDARRALAADYLASRQTGGSSIVLAHSNADVQALNEAVRAHRRDAGELGEGAAFAASKGKREFAAGDRLVFLSNDRKLNVKNGQLGTVEQAEAGSLVVRLDNGEVRTVEQDVYQAVDHGYAVTIHKSQGVTVDRAFVLASQGMDKHLAYVAMTRHRDDARLYAGQDDFDGYDVMAARLGRTQPKASTLDFDTAAFADRRGFDGLAVLRHLVERGRQLMDRLRGRLDVAAERLGLMTSEPAPGRVDLVVPFPQKDRAKAAGAHFDGATKRWYAPDGDDLGALAEWLPDEQERRAAVWAAREAEAKEKARAALEYGRQRAAVEQEQRQQQADEKAKQRAAEAEWLAKRAAAREAVPSDPLAELAAKWRQPSGSEAPGVPQSTADIGLHTTHLTNDIHPHPNPPPSGTEPERGYEP